MAREVKLGEHGVLETRQDDIQSLVLCDVTDSNASRMDAKKIVGR